MLGCRGPTGPRGGLGSPLVYITGDIRSPTPWDSTGYVYLTVYDAPEVPSVKINGINIPRLPVSDRFADRDFPISPGDSVELLVSYTMFDGGPGIARANIRMPAQFQITSHDTSSIIDTFPIGEDLVVTWTSSGGADGYTIHFFIGYSYWDTLGNEKSFRSGGDTLTADTSINLPSHILFPNFSEIDSIHHLGVTFSVSAVAGPLQEGADGNVTGDGLGLFHGRTYGGDLKFQLTSSTCPAARKEGPRVLFESVLEERKKRLGLF